MSLFSKPAVILQMFEMLVYWLEEDCTITQNWETIISREFNRMKGLLFYDWHIDLNIKVNEGIRRVNVDAVFQPTRTTQYVRARSSIIAGGGSKIFYVVYSPFIDDPYNLQWVPYDREARKIYQLTTYYATPPIWDVW